MTNREYSLEEIKGYNLVQRIKYTANNILAGVLLCYGTYTALKGITHRNFAATVVGTTVAVMGARVRRQVTDWQQTQTIDWFYDSQKSHPQQMLESRVQQS